MNQSLDKRQLHAAADVTSNSLIELVRSRDETAWRCLTELYGPLVYHWCRKAGLNGEDSADVLQEVFRSLVIHIQGFEKTAEKGSFRAWLWTITRNKIRDHVNLQAHRTQATGGTDAQLELLNVPEQEPTDSADSAVSAIGGLPYRAIQIVRGEVEETTWLAFWRSTIDEVSPAAVAQELGISIDSVYQAKSRILRRLRELLQ